MFLKRKVHYVMNINEVAYAQEKMGSIVKYPASSEETVRITNQSSISTASTPLNMPVTAENLKRKKNERVDMIY